MTELNTDFEIIAFTSNTNGVNLAVNEILVKPSQTIGGTYVRFNNIISADIVSYQMKYLQIRKNPYTQEMYFVLTKEFQNGSLKMKLPKKDSNACVYVMSKPMVDFLEKAFDIKNNLLHISNNLSKKDDIMTFLLSK